MVWGLPHRRALRQRLESDECRDCNAAWCSCLLQAIPNIPKQDGQSILDRPKQGLEMLKFKGEGEKEKKKTEIW